MMMVIVKLDHEGSIVVIRLQKMTDLVAVKDPDRIGERVEYYSSTLHINHPTTVTVREACRAL